MNTSAQPPEEKAGAAGSAPGKTSRARLFFRPLLLVSAGLALLSLILRIIASRSAAFADFFTDHIASLPRMLLGKLTSLLPFSLGETLILLSPFFFVAFLIVAWEKLAERGGFLRLSSLPAASTPLLARISLRSFSIFCSSPDRTIPFPFLLTSCRP